MYISIHIYMLYILMKNVDFLKEIYLIKSISDKISINIFGNITFTGFSSTATNVDETTGCYHKILLMGGESPRQ
jgi:hypothetical protein